MGGRGFFWLGLLSLGLVLGLLGCANGQEDAEIEDPPEAVGDQEDADTDDIAEEPDEVDQAEEETDLSTLGGMWRMTPDFDDVRVTMATGDYSDWEMPDGYRGTMFGTAELGCAASGTSCIVQPAGDEAIHGFYELRIEDGVPVLFNSEFGSRVGQPAPWMDGCDWPSVDEAGIVSIDGPDTWRFTNADYEGEGESCLQVVYEVVVTRAD